MKLLVLDGNSLVNRAYFGIKLLTTKDGRDVYKRQVAETANRSRGSGRRVRGAFAPEARCGYRNPTLSSILATQMPCRSRRSGA